MSPVACHASASEFRAPALVSLFEIRWQGVESQSLEASSHAESRTESHSPFRGYRIKARQDTLPPETNAVVRVAGDSPPSHSLGIECSREAAVSQTQQQQQLKPEAMGCCYSRSAVEYSSLATTSSGANGSDYTESSGKGASKSGARSLFSAFLPSTCLYRVFQKRGQEQYVSTVAGDRSFSGSSSPSQPAKQSPPSLQGAPLKASAPPRSVQARSATVPETLPAEVDRIPDELLRQIFSHLNVPDFLRVAWVCHRWHALALDPSLWTAAFCRAHGLLSLRLPPSTGSLPALLAAHASRSGDSGGAGGVGAGAGGDGGAGAGRSGDDAALEPAPSAATPTTAAAAATTTSPQRPAPTAVTAAATETEEASGRNSGAPALAPSLSSSSLSHSSRASSSPSLSPSSLSSSSRSSSSPSLSPLSSSSSSSSISPLLRRRCFLSVFSLLSAPEFALSHPIGRSDSIASLAVRYHVQAMDIRRLNNMLSDHAIHTRTRLLIPIPAARRLAELEGRHCAVQFDSHARREVVLVLRDGEEGEEVQEEHETRAGRQAAAERGTAQVVSLLQKALQIDEATARYYLDESGGDVRAAVALFMEDQQWEWAQARAGERRRILAGSGRR